MIEVGTKEIQKMYLHKFKIVHRFLVERHIEYYMIGGTLLGSVRHGGFIPWDNDIDIGMTRKNYEKFLKCFNEIDHQQFKVINYRNEKVINNSLTKIAILNTHCPYTRIKDIYNHNYHIDIFPIDNVPLSEKQEKKQKAKLTKYKKLMSLKVMESSNGFRKIVLYMIRFVLLPLTKKNIAAKIDKISSQYANQEGTKYLCSMSSHYSYDTQKMDVSIYGEPKLYRFEDTKFYGPEKANDYLIVLFGPNYLVPVKKDDFCEEDTTGFIDMLY